jgi:prevent-host-death family protein
MKTVNIHAAKTHLSSLVEEAAAGEEIIIAKAGQPRARLVKLEKKQQDVASTRGKWKGKIWMSDDFDAPLPPEILRSFGIEE